MFCSVCGCQLPAIAQFCVKCGSRIEKELQPSVALPVQATPTGSKLFCVHCGHPYDVSHRFCNSCGQPTAASQSAASTPSESATGFATAVVQQAEPPNPGPGPATSAPPFALFALSSLAAGMMISVVAFNIADGAARGTWDHTPSTTAAAALVLLFCAFVVKTWDRLRRGNHDGGTNIASKKLRTRSIVFGVLFIGTAAIMGAAIGTSGAETDQFVADSHDAKQIGERITSARTSATRTVPAQIEMYRGIESEVLQWESVLHRMRKELDIYDQKYPAQHESTLSAVRSVDLALKRADLLRHQIAVAKEIEPLPDTAQWTAWETRMQPLWDQETALDNEK